MDGNNWLQSRPWWNSFKQNSDKHLPFWVKLVSFVAPLTVLPQLYQIWVLKNTSGVSSITWVLFMIMSIPIFLYVLSKEEWHLSMMYGIYHVFYVVILLGLFLY